MLRPSLFLLLPVLCLGAPPSDKARPPAGHDLAMAAVIAGPDTAEVPADTRASGRTWAKANDPPDAEACLGHGRAFAAGCRAYVDDRQAARDAQLAANFR